MSKTKTPKTPKTQTSRKPKTIYSLVEKTDLAKPIADCTSATEALKRASEYANEHQVAVEISRGTLTGESFKAEFTEMVIPTTPELTASQEPATTEAIPSQPVEPNSPEPKTSGRVKKPEPKPRKMSALAAAAKVLAKTGEPMTTKTLIETMTGEGLWDSPNGKTPQATLYTAVTMVPKCAPLGAFSKRAG